MHDIHAEAALELIDRGAPVLRGVSALLQALTLAAGRNLLSGPGGSEALALLADRVDSVMELFAHWQDTGPHRSCGDLSPPGGA